MSKPVERCAIKARHLLFLVVGIAALAAQGAAAEPPLPQTSPEDVGFSEKRLERLDTALRGLVNEGELAGVSTAVARHGKLVYNSAFGEKDMEAEEALSLDTIHRIYSMTKPITGVAMMILYEEGKWELTDPVAEHIPEFEGLKVYAGMDEDGEMILEEQTSPMTMRQLMSHTAGFTYGVFGASPVDKMYQKAGVLEGDSLQSMIDKLSDIPLLYQPGERWVYSVSVDIQGYLVEKLSGQSFASFLQDRIFEPLGMEDTAFYVPEDKRERFATLYSFDPDEGRLTPVTGQEFGAGDYATPPGLASGGAGLVSTLGDYLRFAQMMLNGGELDGTRILSPQTVKLMRSNHLPDNLTGTAAVGPGTNFGLDFAVVSDPAKAGALYGKGTYYWGGAAGTWFWIDPKYDIAVAGMIQRMGAGGPGAGPNMHNITRTAIYQALTHPEQ